MYSHSSGMIESSHIWLTKFSVLFLSIGLLLFSPKRNVSGFHDHRDYKE
jgi:hypothetical protein